MLFALVNPLIINIGSGTIVSMGRKRTQLTLTPAEQTELAHRLQTATDTRQQERLRFVLLAAEGRHTLEDLAERLGRARSTLQLWLEKFAAAGLAGVLERESPPGLPSPMAAAAMQSEHQAGLQAGRWRSAAAIADWLQTAHGITRARKSIYYWLGRNGWAAPGGKLAADHRSP
jgi:transposase-like protein